MALIKCEECGHMVSDKATSCPNCGAPVNQQSQQGSEPEHDQNGNNHGFYEYEEEPNNKNNLIWAIVAVAILAILGIGYYFYHDYKVKEAEKEAIEQARQDSIAAAKLEAERLEKLRQDSIAQIEKIKDGMPVPSDFIKQNYTCITKLKFSVIVKNLERKGLSWLIKRMCTNLVMT